MQATIESLPPTILQNFPITEEEYKQLESKFGALCHYAAWQLFKKNNKNNLTDEQEDIVQELRIALIRSGSYYKRQTYIESSFKALHACVKDEFTQLMIIELWDLWKNRIRHGAGRQKFGWFQENILDQLLAKYVPKSMRPDKSQPLQIDLKFTTYCKQIAWNAQKLMGKKITREKSWRTGLVSLSEFSHLDGIYS